jgi:hypothetical protein
MAAALADTNELQGDWTNGGRLDVIIDAILVDTGTTLDDFIDTEVADLVTSVNLIEQYLDTEIAAILVDTGTTLDDFIDTEIADLITSVNLIEQYLDTEAAAILADTNELQTDWANGGRLDNLLDGASAPTSGTVADAVWDELIAGHAGVGSTGQSLSAAGSAADVLLNDVPGTYTLGTAGYALGNIVEIREIVGTH